jgi:hypothetical protein
MPCNQTSFLDSEEVVKATVYTESTESYADRRHFIGGSDARIIMGQDEKALVRLWQEKRGEVGPEDLSANLIVQLGLVTEDLNRQWHERKRERPTRTFNIRLLAPSRPQFPRKQPHFFPVLENKFNTGFFQCAAKSFHSLLRNLSTLFFEIYDRRQPQRGFFCKLRLGHVQQSASCPTLRRGHSTNNFC